MLEYDIEFEYDVHEWGDIILPANNLEHAKEEALKYVKETFPDVTNIKITDVQEIAQ